MEHLNKVILCGVVGTSKHCDMQGKRLTRFSVATNLCSKDRDGVAQIETTWHTVAATEGEKITREILDDIKAGMIVELTGRIKNINYTSANGETHFTSEIIPTEIKVYDRSQIQLNIEKVN